MGDSFRIEAEGVPYRQEYLNSEDGIRLQLWVAKTGLMPLLQTVAGLAGTSDAKEMAARIAASAELQGKLLAGVYEVLQAVSYEDVQMLKDLVAKVTWLQKPGEQPSELPLNALPNHFNSIVDNARLYSLIAQSIKVQLAPLFRAQFISQISARLTATE